MTFRHVLIGAILILGGCASDDPARQAAIGDRESQFELGWIYMEGSEAIHDDYQAVEWFRMAAEQEHGAAQLFLGWHYLEGRGVEQDDAEAIRWYRKAAEQDFAQAQYALGWHYFEGQGVEEDPEQALAWFRKAAAQGDAPAQEALQALQTNGLIEFSENRTDL